MRTLEQFPLGFRLSNAIVSVVRYLLKTIWPFDLAVFYPAPARWDAWVVIACALLLAGITAAAVWARRRAPYVLVGWLWFCGMLIPVIGLVQVGRQAMADRYTYLPHIGLFIAVAWLVAGVANERARRAVVAICACAVLALAIRAADEVRHWRNTDALFAHALAVTDENAIALNQVGNARARQNDLPGAEELYRRALQLDPDYGMAHMNLANLLVRRRDFAGAVDHYESALRWRSNLPRAQLGLAVALTGLRDYPRADRAFAEALRLSPWLADAQLSWGLSLRERGDFDAAIPHFQAALSLNPNLDLARRALAGPAPSTAPATTAPAASSPAPASP
jgi:Tfp pilus assembly protein PilF